MTVETALYPNQLNASWPAQSDIVREGAGHIRAVKTVLKTTFPNVTGAVTPTHVELNYMVGVTSGVQAQINTKGAIAGQTWTGTHVFPSTTTVGPLTPTIQGYLATVTSDAQAQINTKAAKAGDTYTGAHNFGGATSVTLPAATSIGSVSDVEIGYLDGVTAPVQSQLAGKADINGESYTGTHDFTGATVQVATQPAGTSNTTPASTEFVAATAFSSALPAQAGNAGKLLATDGTNASWRLFTTLSAYGITDAVNTTGDQTVAGNKSFSGNLLATGGALGYGVGAGGTASQPGQNSDNQAKNLTVALHKPTGVITMGNASLGASTTVTFQLRSNAITTSSTVSTTILNSSIASAGNYRLEVVSNFTGGVFLRLTNLSGGALAEALQFHFNVHAGATS